MWLQGNKPVHRVVTLGGDLIDKSGTLSGGGKTVRRGGMSAVAVDSGITQEMVRDRHMGVSADQ